MLKIGQSGADGFMISTTTKSLYLLHTRPLNIPPLTFSTSLSFMTFWPYRDLPLPPGDDLFVCGQQPNKLPLFELFRVFPFWPRMRTFLNQWMALIRHIFATALLIK